MGPGRICGLLRSFLLGSLNLAQRDILRISLLRFLLVSSVACLLATPFAAKEISIANIVILVSISGTILIHHSLSAFIIKWIPTYLDFVLTTLECTTLFIYLQPWMWTVGRYDSSAGIIIVVAIYLQTGFLCLLLLIRVSVMAVTIMGTFAGRPFNFKSLAQPFDLLAQSRASTAQGQDRKAIIVGYSVWRKLLSEEPATITVLRGVSAIAMIGGLLAFLVTNVIVDPVSETGRNPQKQFRSDDIANMLKLERDNQWKIIAFLAFDEVDHISNASVLHNAIEVTPLWDDRAGFKPPCTSTPEDQMVGSEENSRMALYPLIQLIEFTCPDRLNISSQADRTAFDYINSQSGDVWPDLLIRVNFTMLGIDATSLSNTRGRTVSIVLGLTENTETVLANMLPIPLIPDAHLFGGITAIIRQRFKRADFAALGIFSAMTTYLAPVVSFLIPDPSLLIPRDPNTATLRLYMQSDSSEWIFVFDYREKSVWAGISTFGGFWTSLNGFFVFIFGTNLLLILFDTKPLSIFGLIHKFKPVQLVAKYPKIMSEDEVEPGLIAYIRDHFIDLGPCQKKGIPISASVEPDQPEDVQVDTTSASKGEEEIHLLEYGQSTRAVPMPV